MHNTDRYDRECENDINIMVIGIPNVGKSSLLNDIRRYHLNLHKPVAGVAKLPGYTKSVSFKTRVSLFVFIVWWPFLFLNDYSCEVMMLGLTCRQVVTMLHLQQGEVRDRLEDDEFLRVMSSLKPLCCETY